MAWVTISYKMQFGEYHGDHKSCLIKENYLAYIIWVPTRIGGLYWYVARYKKLKYYFKEENNLENRMSLNVWYGD